MTQPTSRRDTPPLSKIGALPTKPMSASPRISIITPAYNAENYVKRVTQSVLSQRNIDFEWIIVDDCSTDNTYVAFHADVCGDPRVRLIQAPRNGGVSDARNLALAHAVGEYICFLDADDSWAPDKLALQYQFMQTSEADVTAMDYLRVNELQIPLGVVRAPPVITWRMMLKSNRIGNLTAMVRRSLLTDIKFRRIGHEDYVFWLDVARKARLILRVPITEPLCFYTVRSSSISADKRSAAKWQWMIYRSVLKMNFIVSCWFFLNYAIIALMKRLSLGSSLGRTP
jgi:teichuronic acid biosynthesis glycosyltransferase TuaG